MRATREADRLYAHRLFDKGLRRVMRLVTVSIVRDDGNAAKIGIQPNDLIYRINGAPVASPQAVTDTIAAGSAQFTLLRAGKLVEVSVESSSLGVVLNEVEFDEGAWLRDQAIENVLLTTAQSVADRRIIKTLDIVGAQCIYGVNAFADLAAGIREFVGGRSQGLQRKIAEARQEVCRELRAEAHMLGGNGVIAVAFEYTEIGDKGGYMLMVTGAGTSVVLE